MGFRGISALSALSIFVITACGELPGFQVGQKSDYGVQSIEPIDFTDLDILFVVDNSGSMAEEQDNLADSFESFITQFAERDLNFQIGVISTDVTTGVNGWWQGTQAIGGGCTPAYQGIFNGGPGTLLSKYPAYKYLTPAVPDYINKFKNNVRLGICGTGAETGVLAAHSFLSPEKIGEGGYNEGFIRPDAFLAVIFLSDEDESISSSNTAYVKSNPAMRATRVSSFKERLESIKPERPELLRVDAIVAPSQAECPTVYNSFGSGVGEVYMELAGLFNGQTSNICQDFSSQLVGIGTQILTFLTRFPLLQPPVGADVEVRVNGSLVPKGEVNGWVLIEESGKYFVEFRGTEIPNNGDQIQITYVPARPLD
jgi:hypothetical protein